tara:strand:- start:23562 stop:23948 length:387 start_codon:yes stop_codon:yes gene_type:complete
MPLSQEEVVDIKTDLRVLKSSISDMSMAQTENTKAQTAVARQISNLLIEMKERDVRDEYLATSVSDIKERQDEFEAFSRPIIVRTKKHHDFRDKVKDGFGSNAGKLLFLVFAACVAYALGIDPSKWKF